MSIRIRGGGLAGFESLGKVLSENADIQKLRQALMSLAAATGKGDYNPGKVDATVTDDPRLDFQTVWATFKALQDGIDRGAKTKIPVFKDSAGAIDDILDKIEEYVNKVAGLIGKSLRDVMYAAYTQYKNKIDEQVIKYAAKITKVMKPLEFLLATGSAPALPGAGSVTGGGSNVVLSYPSNALAIKVGSVFRIVRVR